MHVAITGNIGCGKSTFLNVMRTVSPFDTYHVFDYDECVRDLYETDEDFQSFLQHTFGTCVRSEVSNIVHADPSAMRKLLTASFVWTVSMIEQALDQYENLILDIPLLFEILNAMDDWTQIKSKINWVICITAPDDDRRARVLERDGITIEKYNSIVKKQLPQETKSDYSDFTVHNNFRHVSQFADYANLWIRNNLSRKCNG